MNLISSKNNCKASPLRTKIKKVGVKTDLSSSETMVILIMLCAFKVCRTNFLANWFIPVVPARGGAEVALTIYIYI